jgi:hypothetical protein
MGQCEKGKERTEYDNYHLLGDDNHHSHRRGNLKSYKGQSSPLNE